MIYANIEREAQKNNRLCDPNFITCKRNLNLALAQAFLASQVRVKGK